MRKIRLQLKVELDKVDYSALNWYQDANKLIRQLYGKHWKLFCDILAATSPRKQVKANWRIADVIVRAYIDRANNPGKFGDLLGGNRILPAHRNNIVRALAGRKINGQKVWRFAENLKGDLNVVTIDVWLCRAYGIDDKLLTSSLYKRLEKRIQRDAKRCKVTPAGYQAVIWYAIRRLHGLRAKSFVSVYRSIFMETPYFAFMQE